MRLIIYAASMNMVIENTLFPHKNIHKAFWKSPDGSETNQIDQALIHYHHKGSLQDVRSYRVANIDCGHFLITAKLWSRINKQHITPRTIGRKAYDILKLNDPEVATRYMNNLKSQIGINEYALDLDNGNWTVSKQIISNAAEEVIKKRAGGKGVNGLIRGVKKQH
jgi:hypothetical protein